jgi:hypothetical protein
MQARLAVAALNLSAQAIGDRQGRTRRKMDKLAEKMAADFFFGGRHNGFFDGKKDRRQLANFC